MEEIKKKILTRMDEVGTDGMIQEQIMPLLDEYLTDGLNKYLEYCPHRDLTPTKMTIQAEKKGDHYYQELPEDFLRLIKLTCKEWQVDAHYTHETEHPLYKREFNKYLRSPYNSPLAFRVQDHLVYRGTAEEIQYQKRITHDNINRQIKNQDLAAWYVAGEMFTIFQEIEKANICFQKSLGNAVLQNK